MKIKLFNKLPILENYFEKDENNREINIYKIINCSVTGMNLYYPNVLLKSDSMLILPLMEKTMSLNYGTIYEKDDMYFNCPTQEITDTYSDPLFFFIYNIDNYFHFIYDTLPYLISYLKIKKTYPNLKLLMQYPNEQKKEFYPFIIEFLDILNIKTTDIVLVNTRTNYRNLYISTSYTHDIDSNLPPRKEIYDFFQEIVRLTKNNYKLNNTPKKIYISRRTWLHNDFSNIGTNYTTRRKFTNETEFVNKLIDEGYSEIFTEKLSTIEKIIYFSNATHVIGAIGGGISNVLFSPKDTYLEALISPTFLDVNKRFKYSINRVNINYNYNTLHVESTEFKTYMRIKTKDGRIIGEILQIYDNEVLVSYTENNNNIGWNSQNEYDKIKLNIQDIIKLDNGLNSPWKLLF